MLELREEVRDLALGVGVRPAHEAVADHPDPIGRGHAATLTQAPFLRLDSTTASMNLTPGHPVLHRGHQRGRRVGRATLELGPDQLGGVAVDGGEALEIAFGVAGGDAGDPARHGVGARPAAPDQPRRLAVGGEVQVVRILLRPAQPALVAVDADAAARSRCRVRPGSPTACPWPRRRSAA